MFNKAAKSVKVEDSEVENISSSITSEGMKTDF